MKHITTVTCITLLLSACGGDINKTVSPTPEAQKVPAFAKLQQTPVTAQTTPFETISTRTGDAPSLGGSSMLFSVSGPYSQSGSTLSGSATFTNAPVADIHANVPPSTFGTGSIQDIVLGGVNYTHSGMASIAGVFPESPGNDFLVLSSFYEEQQPSGVIIGTVLHVIIPATDFAPGVSVNFDGNDRLAFFARGEIDQPDPQLVGAAMTGTVTFSAGGLATGDLITASMTGDFAEVAISPAPPPPNGTLTAGTYQLTFDPQIEVFCDGTLMGQEAAFASITLASLGFIDGTVTLAGPNGVAYTLSGAPISSGFAQSSLVLDAMPDSPPGMVGGYVNASGVGPLGTQLMGTYLMLDGTLSSATQVVGYAGAGFMNVAQDGYCQTAFLIELTP